MVLASTLVLWLGPEHYFGGLPLNSLRYAMLLVLVAGSATFWLFFWPLKRVEANGDFLYVSNYFRAARYGWTSEVAKLDRRRFLFLEFGVVELQGAGTFGRSFRFVASRRLLDDFLLSHPELEHMIN